MRSRSSEYRSAREVHGHDVQLVGYGRRVEAVVGHGEKSAPIVRESRPPRQTFDVARPQVRQTAQVVDQVLRHRLLVPCQGCFTRDPVGAVGGRPEDLDVVGVASGIVTAFEHQEVGLVDGQYLRDTLDARPDEPGVSGSVR